MMRGEEQQKSRALYELCALVLSLLRSPHLATPSSSAPEARPRASVATVPRGRREVTPAGFASLLLGASLALMLCGSVTFVVGFMLLPWVLGLVVMLYFVGIVSNLSGLGRAVLCPQTPPREMPGHLFSKIPT